MAKKATAAEFLSKMGAAEEPDAPTPQAAPTKAPEAKPAKGRAGLKHIGGYFDRATVEQVAILRARLDLDNSQLIKRAIDDLYKREVAAKKFGDR